MGRAIARRLAAEGAGVHLFARRPDALEDAVAEIAASSGSGRAIAVAGDSTLEADLAGAVDQAHQAFGRIDIVINNTGGPPVGDFGDLDDDAWQAGFELTLLSALRLTRLALPMLRRSRRGRVVNITSMAVKEVNDGLLLSNACVLGSQGGPSISRVRRGRTGSP